MYGLYSLFCLNLGKIAIQSIYWSEIEISMLDGFVIIDGNYWVIFNHNTGVTSNSFSILVW